MINCVGAYKDVRLTMFYSIIASAQILRVAAIATFCFFLSHVTHADDIDVYNTQKALPHTPYPVSYTHLTLPTIYSV